MALCKLQVPLFSSVIGHFLTNLMLTLHVSTLGLRFCDCETTNTSFGSYNWSESVVGDVLKLPCEFRPVFFATRVCGAGGIWLKADYSNCRILC